MGELCQTSRRQKCILREHLSRPSFEEGPLFQWSPAVSVLVILEFALSSSSVSLLLLGPVTGGPTPASLDSLVIAFGPGLANRKPSGDWRLGEGRNQGISHSLLCPGPTRCLLCGSDSLMVSRATPVRLTPHQAPAWRTSRLLPDGEEPSSLGKRVLSLTVHPLLPASVWSGENSSPI